MPPIQRPPNDGSGGGDEKKSPLERYLEKQKKTREPKSPRENLDSRRVNAPPRASTLVAPPTSPVATPSPPENPVAPMPPRASLADRHADTSKQPGPPEPVAADVFTRFIAVIIDAVAVACLQWTIAKVVLAAMSLIFGGIPGEARTGLELLLFYVVMFFYFGTFYSMKGASPGKMLMGLEIYDEGTGRYLTPWKAFLREAVGKMVSAIPLWIGYVVALFRDDRKALHDLLFDTRVVRNIRASKSGKPTRPPAIS